MKHYIMAIVTFLFLTTSFATNLNSEDIIIAKELKEFAETLDGQKMQPILEDTLKMLEDSDIIKATSGHFEKEFELSQSQSEKI